jgi:hypothetical protein
MQNALKELEFRRFLFLGTLCWAFLFVQDSYRFTRCPYTLELV